MRYIGFIKEHYLNITKQEDKEEYADVVWEMIIESYSYIGGIKGSGFLSKEDMIKNIVMWKLVKKNGRILSCLLYKDSSGRKLVAGASDGTKEGKESFKLMFKEEITNALLKLAYKMFGGVLKKYLIPVKSISKILQKTITTKDDYNYSRNIGGIEINKIMYGIPSIKIV